MSPSEVNPQCLICEDSIHCFGRCAGVPDGQPVEECFRAAANRPGDLDPLTGSAREPGGQTDQARPEEIEFSPSAAAEPKDASPQAPAAALLPDQISGGADRWPAGRPSPVRAAAADFTAINHWQDEFVLLHNPI